MLTTLLWVALVAGAPAELQEHSAITDFLAQATKTIAETQSAPAADPAAPGGAPAVPDLAAPPDAPTPKETRSPAYETVPGPAMKVQTGRAPKALQ